MTERFERFSFFLTEIHRYIKKLENEEMEKLGLKGSYAVYFIVIGKSAEKITSARLTELCGRNKADISRAVKDLSEKGFIKKDGRDGNYRAPLVLTEKGADAYKKLKGITERAVSLVGGSIPESRLKAFYDTLDEILENLRTVCSNESAFSKL
jgi:DNA-binding MarR family transcriptional regulator